MNREIGKLTRDGKNITGEIAIFYKEVVLETGDVEIIGSFSARSNTLLDWEPYQIELKSGRSGQVVIRSISTGPTGARKVGFVGGLAEAHII